MKTAVFVIAMLFVGLRSSAASHSEFAQPQPNAQDPRPDDLLALMEAVTRGHGRVRQHAAAEGTDRFRAGNPNDPKLRGKFAQASDLSGSEQATPDHAQPAQREPSGDASVGLLQTPELEQDILSSLKSDQPAQVQVEESSEPESSKPHMSTQLREADKGGKKEDAQGLVKNVGQPEEHALLQLASSINEQAEPKDAGPADDARTDCSKLSAADAAAVAVEPAVRIVMLVLTVCYMLGAAVLAKICLTEHSHIRERCPALLLSHVTLGLIILAVLSIPVEISDVGILARLLQWTDIVGVPAIMLIHGVRLLHCRAQYFLYMKRRALVGTASSSKSSRKAAAQSKEGVSADESVAMMQRAKALAVDSRFMRQLAVFIAPLLVAGASVQLFVSSCTVLGSSAMAFGVAVGVPAFGALCVGLIGLACTRVSDGYLIKVELLVVVVLDIAFAVAQAVLGVMHPGASSLVIGLLQTYRVGVAVWLLLGIAAHLGFAVRVHWPASAEDKAAKFEAIFDQPQLRRHFEERLHRCYAGGLMMLWEEIDDFRAKFAEQDEPKPDDATPQANLRRDTVRKAKLGLAARAIWNKYLVADAPMEMDSLDPLLREELSNRINCNTISHLMFDAVQEIAFDEMRIHFKRFTVPTKEAVYAEL